MSCPWDGSLHGHLVAACAVLHACSHPAALLATCPVYFYTRVGLTSCIYTVLPLFRVCDVRFVALQGLTQQADASCLGWGNAAAHWHTSSINRLLLLLQQAHKYITHSCHAMVDSHHGIQVAA